MRQACRASLYPSTLSLFASPSGRSISSRVDHLERAAYTSCHNHQWHHCSALRAFIDYPPCRKRFRSTFTPLLSTHSFCALPLTSTVQRHLTSPANNMPHLDPFEPIDEGLDLSSDSEDETLQNQTFSDKRRQENALFHSWCLNEGGAALRAAKEAERKSGEDENEQVSIKDLLAKQDNAAVIIKSPREYQIELFERAKTQNTIAVLDTGSGKTLIAVLLLRHIIDQELERRASGKPHRVAFFIVPKVNLVLQQGVVLERNLGCTVTQIHGAMNVDAWSEDYWAKVLSETDVVVCTADILLHGLSRSFIRMSSISLIVFDEVHHAKLGHPYSR